MSVEIQRVGAARTLELRQRVLRPRETLADVSWPGDDDPDTAHFGALAGGRVVAVASVRREVAPGAAASPSWRLRGMATAEDWRNQGVGTAVLAAVIEHVAGNGGGRLWCNARVAAVPFYARAGFVTRGERWEEPAIGPHIAMERFVQPTPA